MPYSYLTKPFKNTDLLASVEVAVRRSARAADVPTIVVKEDNFNVDLPIHVINYIQSAGNYLFVHTDERTYKCRATIGQIMQSLPKTDFIQTHRAFVVNKNRIDKYNSKSLMINGTEIPVSKKFWREFQSSNWNK